MPDPDKKSSLSDNMTETSHNTVQKIEEHITLLHAYGDKYLFMSPRCKEGSEEIDWESFNNDVQRIMSQVGLKEVIKELRPSRKTIKQNILGKRAVVIRSDLPLVYTVFDPERRQGTAEGYIGYVRSYSIFKRANLYRRRIELTRARKIDITTKDSELVPLITVVYLGQRSGYYRGIEEEKFTLSCSRLGGHNLTVEDLFPNIVMYVVDTEQTVRNLYPPRKDDFTELSRKVIDDLARRMCE